MDNTELETYETNKFPIKLKFYDEHNSLIHISKTNYLDEKSTFFQIIEYLVYKEDIKDYKDCSKKGKNSSFKSCCLVYNNDIELGLSKTISDYLEEFMGDIKASNELIVNVYISNEECEISSKKSLEEAGLVFATNLRKIVSIYFTTNSLRKILVSFYKVFE